MRRPVPPRLACFAVVLALGACSDERGAPEAAPASPAASDAEAEPRTTMDAIFDVVAELLPEALDERRFQDPTRRSTVQGQLDRLAAAAERLEDHASRRDVNFGFLSRSLASDVAEARRRYALGRFDEARFYVVSATQNCVTCHARVASARDFPMAERLTERVEITSLSPRERAHFYVVTRRFDDALATWESFFASPETTSADLDAAGTLLDYLVIALRVERDPERARRTLARLAGRYDLRGYLRGLASGWVEQLDALADAAKEPPSLDRARALIEEADALAAGPDRAVHHLVASAHLHDVIDGGQATGPERAEAYYLLGRVEAETADSFWVPQAEFHLETAIRTAPGSESARRAYALLEEYTAAGWGGSGGEHLPEDVRAKLAELRALIDADS